MPLFDAEYRRKATRYRHSYNEILIGTYTRPTQGCRFEWPWVTLSDLVKSSMTRSVARSLYDSWTSCYFCQRSSEGYVIDRVYHPRSDGVAMVVLFSVVSVCGYVYVCSSRRLLLNRLRYHHEVSKGTGYSQKVGRVRKWLHSDTLRRTGVELPEYKNLEAAVMEAPRCNVTREIDGWLQVKERGRRDTPRVDLAFSCLKPQRHRDSVRRLLGTRNAARSVHCRLHHHGTFLPESKVLSTTDACVAERYAWRSVVALFTITTTMIIYYHHSNVQSLINRY